jgi:hypothetical protein
MKRNRVALWLLLVSLFGLAPSAFACSTRQSSDVCCPAGKHPPCEQPSPPSALLRETICCSAQSTASPASVGLSPARKQHASPASPAPLDPPLAARVATKAGAVWAVPLSNGDYQTVDIDQSRLYLLTGRLRL